MRILDYTSERETRSKTRKLNNVKNDDEYLFTEIGGSKLTALVGSDVQLPCNITSAAQNDVISTIFWYKGDTFGSPIYTVDSRNSSSIHEASHFSNELLRNRASFNLSVQFAFLSISPLKEEDSGEYRCRVDFRWSRTMNTVIQLEVIGKYCTSLSFILISQISTRPSLHNILLNIVIQRHLRSQITRYDQ